MRGFGGKAKDEEVYELADERNGLSMDRLRFESQGREIRFGVSMEERVGRLECQRGGNVSRCGTLDWRTS